MNDEKRNIARQRLQNSKAYQRLETIQKVLDQYCLDGFMGLIPYGIGDIIDFFHRSNRQNMQLVRGFVEGDVATIKEVNRQAVSLSILIIIFLILIFALIYFAVVTAQWIFNLFAN